MNKKRQRLIAAALRWQAAMDEADSSAYGDKERDLLDAARRYRAADYKRHLAERDKRDADKRN